MILEWLKKFFLYFNDNGYVSTFSDGLGEGAFGYRHFIWIGLVLVLSVGGYYYFKKHPNIVPKPLDIAIEKIWGFTSEQGRHLREGQAPEYLEAELVVELSAAISTYLGKKLSGTNTKVEDDDLPF